MPGPRRRPWGEPKSAPVPEFHWEGNTSDLLRRLNSPPVKHNAAWERCLWFALGTAVALSSAAILSSRRPESEDLHVVTTGPDRIMWVSRRSGDAGGCFLEHERVRCVKTDWMSGPLDVDVEWSLDE